MALDTWTAYFLASILIAFSPGSGAVLAMSHGLSYGVRRTQATIAGLQAGLLVPTEEEALTVRATRDALAKIDANPERLLS